MCAQHDLEKRVPYDVQKSSFSAGKLRRCLLRVVTRYFTLYLGEYRAREAEICHECTHVCQHYVQSAGVVVVCLSR